MKRPLFTSCLALTLVASTLTAAPALAGSIAVDGQFVSTAPTGTPPIAVQSTTMVANLNANFLGGLPASAFAADNVLTVSTHGGRFSSIQAAIDSIGDASFGKIYLVLVAPGVYYESLTLKNFVIVRGAERGLTIVRAEGTGNVTGVVGSAVAVIGDLRISVESTDGGDAVGLTGDTFLVERVTIEATTAAPGRATGVRLESSQGIALRDSEILAANGAINTGISMETPAYLTMHGGSVGGQSFADPSAVNYGIRRSFVSGTGQLELDDVHVFGTGGATGYGIRSEQGDLFVSDSSVSADGSSVAVALYNGSGNSGISDTQLTVTGAGATRIGLQQAAGTARVHRGSLGGSPAVQVAAGAEARLAYGQVSGSLAGPGAYACIGNYTSAMSPVVCP